MASPLLRLSKSRFTAGLQCHRQLWWKIHEPDAAELEPDAALGTSLTFAVDVFGEADLFNPPRYP